MAIELSETQMNYVTKMFDEFAEVFRDPVEPATRKKYIAIMLQSRRLHDADKFCRLLPLVLEQHNKRYFPLPADIIDIINPIT